MRTLLSTAALLAMALPAAAQPLPPHPRLLFDAEGVARLKQRVERPEWAPRWKIFRAAVDAALARPVELPPRPANWWHWYVCPRHGVRLTTGRRIGPWQWEHICPVDGEVLRGDPSRPDRDYDAVVTSNIHDGYAREARNAGIVYAVTAEPRYAARVREILLAYAARYLSYPLHTTRGLARIGGGRVTSQTLDESVWLIPLAQGADLVWDTLGEADRRAIADKLFLPAARDVILPHRMGIHNIQNWKNSAVGLTGFLLGDESLIHAAIDDPDRGYRQQMARGVQPDGVWFEGAWGYHFYTISAVWPLTEAARNSGIDLYGDPYKRMFLAPVRLAMPNGYLPAFNDSTEVNIHNDLYELAYARYHDPLLLAGIDRARRTGDYALWFGEDTLPAPDPAPLGSRNFTASGYAILERGQGAGATWLCLKYGPHGGGHGHPDKNNFILFANGRVLFPDPGTRPYGSPLHTEWDRATIAHNTLVVDGANQAEAAGRSLAFGSDGGADYSMTDAGPIYPGVRFVRTAVLLGEKIVLFVDRVTADRDHTFDLALHLAGKWAPPAGDPVEVAYPHVRDARRISSPGDTHLAWDGGAVVLAANEPGEVILATGPGKSTEERVPMAIFRRKGTRAEYIWAMSLDGAEVKLTPGPEAIAVESPTAKWNVRVDVEKALVRVN